VNCQKYPHTFVHTYTGKWQAFVPASHIGLFQNDKNDFLFAAPGMHNIASAFIKKKGDAKPVQDGKENVIVHGNRTIVTVDQGKIGYANDRGQPVLLPPGLHSWCSETLKFEKSHTLENHAIDLGPLTILTVDEGYAAITQNNGKQEILCGGETHLLPHQKWRFEKFITLKIQTDDLEAIRAASADNIIMQVSSTVVWRIKDVHTAALFGADTMAASGRDGEGKRAVCERAVCERAVCERAVYERAVYERVARWLATQTHTSRRCEGRLKATGEQKHSFKVVAHSSPSDLALPPLFTHACV